MLIVLLQSFGDNICMFLITLPISPITVLKAKNGGVRNGPPYPLDAGDHSRAEKKAGWRSSLGKHSSNGKLAGHAPKGRGYPMINRRVIVAGATAVGIGLLVYGAYKTGALDGTIIRSGQSVFNGSSPDNLSDLFKQNISDLGDSSTLGRSAQATANRAAENIRNASEQAKNLSVPSRINESIEDSLKNTNPLLGDDSGRNNCTSCSVAGILRTMGFNVTAKGLGGAQQNLGGIIEDCFKGKMENGVYKTPVFEGGGSKFCRSRKDAEELLLRRFGDNARGVVSVPWKTGGRGHAFSYIIENGKVQFYDFQQKTQNVDSYWRNMDPNGKFVMSRLDNWIDRLNYEGLKKWVDFH